jgi:hypothetical protein
MEIGMSITNRKLRECLVHSDEARILKLLSDGRFESKISVYHKGSLKVISEKLNKECLGRNQPESQGGPNDTIHSLVIERLRSRAQLITSKFSKLLNTLNPNQQLMLPSFLMVFKQITVERKYIDIYKTMKELGYSDGFQQIIDGILERTIKSYERRLDLPPSSPHLEEENQLKVMLIHSFDFACASSGSVLPKKQEQEFLPGRIQQFFTQALQNEYFQLIAAVPVD